MLEQLLQEMITITLLRLFFELIVSVAMLKYYFKMLQYSGQDFFVLLISFHNPPPFCCKKKYVEI